MLYFCRSRVVGVTGRSPLRLPSVRNLRSGALRLRAVAIGDAVLPARPWLLFLLAFPFLDDWSLLPGDALGECNDVDWFADALGCMCLFQLDPASLLVTNHSAWTYLGRGSCQAGPAESSDLPVLCSVNRWGPSRPTDG